MSSTQDTIFPSPGTDASVIAMDVTENQDISLSSSDDPVPILASTAHKERAACDNVEMLNRYAIVQDGVIKQEIYRIKKCSCCNSLCLSVNH